MANVVEITGTITTSDGKKREFSITSDLGWQQWGNTSEALGQTVYILDAITEAAAEYMTSDDEEGEEQ